MHPSTRDWNRFLYTLSDWLVPQHPNTALIEIFQPVPSVATDVWTDNLGTCLGLLMAGERKRILDIAPELLVRRMRKRDSRGLRLAETRGSDFQ